MARKNFLKTLSQAKKELELPVETLFLNALEKTITKENTKPNRTTQTYKPSSLNCLRNMYYQRIGLALGEVLEEADHALVGIGESGTHRHDDTQAYIEKMKENGFPFEYLDVDQYINENNLTNLVVTEKKGHEYKIHDKVYNINFLTDGLIRHITTGKVYVFEFKTEISRKWYPRTDVDEGHYAQTTLYASLFNLDSVIFVYENRDTCEKKSYTFNINPQMKDDIIDKILTCEEYVQKLELPPMVENKRYCYYCKYKKHCKQNENITEVGEEVA